MFPVDCVSHDAVGAIKRLCRRTSKPFIPLRSSSVTSFAAALEHPRIAGMGLDSPLAAAQ
jgi:hypothetical protein